MAYDELKQKRASIKRQVTKFENALKKIDEDTDLHLLDLEGRLSRHNDLWNSFELVQSQIENVVPAVGTDEIHEDERIAFEDRFYAVSGLAKKYIQKMTSSTQSTTIANSVSSRENSQNLLHMSPQNSGRVPTESFAHFHLPKLPAPTFHGTFDTWLAFYDTFKSMCHDNPEIPLINKFMYLRACLTGEAADVIASLETTSENYSVAWELLKNRFDNRKLIVESHIKALVEIPNYSKESSIRSMLDNIQKRVRALKALEQPVEQWDSILIFLIKEKFNYYIRERWEEYVGTNQNPTMKDMVSFLERRSILEATQAAQRPSQSKKYGTKTDMPSRQNSKSVQSCMATTVAKGEKSQSKCPLCSQEHKLYLCDQFLAMPPQKRYEFVKNESMCHNCFYHNHRTIDCKRPTCSKCKKRHNVLLHFENKHQQQGASGSRETPEASTLFTQSTSVDMVNQATSASSTSVVNCHKIQLPSQVILGTAVVEILDNQGRYHLCRALLDSCSQCNSITDKFATFLGLNKRQIQVQLKGVNNLQTDIKYVTSSTIKSRINDKHWEMSFLIFNEISTQVPSTAFDPAIFQIPSNVSLADPGFHRPSEIDILIGAEFYYDFLRTGQLRVPGQAAIVQETDLGWIVAGRYTQPRISRSNTIQICNLIKYRDLPILWELETENPTKPRSNEEKNCETHYIETTTRNKDNRYVVQLPFNDKKDLIGDSRNTAFQRFYALEKKFEKNPTFKAQYAECIQSYLNEGHMYEVQASEMLKKGVYLSHHAVVKDSSLTTKIRVVFDASAKTSTGVSLNDTLLVGPTIQEDLISIVIRFRSFLYALTADIQQMYRQIIVSKDDSLYQQILWRSQPSEHIKIYALNRVTFGTACAPFLAIRTLHKLADDECEAHPIAAKILKRDFYVDDLLTGTQNIEEAVKLRNELIALLNKGGFNLRKWASNEFTLLNDIPSDDAHTHISLDPSDCEQVKTLGLHWNAKSDSIFYTVNLSNSNKLITKRVILSETAKLFDPLGLLSPVIIIAKIMIQQLWKSKLTWDTPVSIETQRAWVDYRNNLPLLNKIQFDRCIVIPNATEIQLHGFCDASEKAYGACLYLRSSDKEGKHHCFLISSKSRVAPLKLTTLPRLELCGAVLLARLYTAIKQSLQMQFSKVYFWSDSTIVLNWINSSPHMLKTFVGNRVAEIQEKTKSLDWRHVPTHDNPADLISRGQCPQEFIYNKVWVQGPHWLVKNDNAWPKFVLKKCDLPEQREKISLLTLKITQEGTNILNKFSRFLKLQSVIGYCLRFMNNIKTARVIDRTTGPLSQTELQAATRTIMKLTQAETFPREIKALSHNQNVDPKSPLYRLTPFLDDGIIKVGGRLTFSDIPSSQKHPIILPRSHNITTIIIRDEHKNLFHAGAHATLYQVRQQYWPLDGRNTTRHIVRQCVTCFRAKPRETNYLMGNLPENRVRFTKAFEHVGVDYCGPFFVKEHRHRNRSKVKTYVSIFVCLATKAVHLELASDLTTDAFIACLSRFFARRGLATSISSDNATNFVGTNNEMRELYNSVKSLETNKETQQFLSTKKVTWHFIPPRAPHFGGLWEAAVKSFKFHFTRIAGNSLLTYEQLHTYVTEIEAILNSRPLTPLSNDPNDLLPLTPSHFLIGKHITSFPTGDLRNIPANRLNCWQLAQQMRRHFWDRWYKEYVNELITRSKWQSHVDQSKIKIGTLVIVKEDNLPPMMWKLGRITATYPGQDGIVRTITLQSATGTYKRSLKHVCPLPIDG